MILTILPGSKHAQLIQSTAKSEQAPTTTLQGGSQSPHHNIVCPLTAGTDYYNSAPKGFHILGYDGAGTVLEVGPECTWAKPGDDVSYVGATTRHGSYAEYQLVSEFQCSLKPKSLDFVQAASYGLTFGTAYQSLYDRLEIKPHENVGILIVCEEAILAANVLVSIVLHCAAANASSCEPDQRRRRSR
jgi:D-arabinose 1-dehydrogenase-like Zn-dependent alcohol dehydrogenase